MRVGIDGTGWSNRRGHGRFTRNVVGRLVEAHGDATYVVYVDEASMQEFELPSNVEVRTVALSRVSVEADSRRGIRDLLRLSSGGIAGPARRVPVPVALHLLPRDRDADRRRRARHHRRGLPAAHAADSAGKDVLVGKAEARAASRDEALHRLAGGARGARRALRPARGSRRRRPRSARSTVPPARWGGGRDRSGRARSSHAVVLPLCRRHQPAQESRDVARCLLEAA